MACKDCSGDCHGETIEDYKEPRYGHNPHKQEVDIKTYLRPIPLNVKPNPATLDKQCTCTRRDIQRYQCLNCIRSYVWAVPYEVSETSITEQRTQGHAVAAERIELELAERKRKEL